MGLNLSELLSRLKNLENSTNPFEQVDAYTRYVNDQVRDLRIINNPELRLAESNLQKSIENYNACIEKIKAKMNSTIFDNKDEYFRTSEDIWKNKLEGMSFEEHLDWAPLWPPREEEFNNFVNNVIQYGTWQLPGVIIGAKNTELIQCANNIEPIYVVEQYPKYFELQKAKFHSDFQRKMRLYKLDDINHLPSNIGLIVIYNEFTFLPWSITSLLLNILVTKLCPGGVIIFNYNDCTTIKGFQNFEKQYMSFTTPEMFAKLLAPLELITKYTSETESFSYLVYKKQGQLKLYKKYPSVGFIRQQKTFSNHPLHQKRLEHIRKLVKSQT